MDGRQIGRRFLLLIDAVGMAVCMFIAAAVVTDTPNPGDGAKSRPVGIATVVSSMFLFAFFFKSSWEATVCI
ncbi:hypothetical protein VTO42DRAFT_869 [Malbranchea cinnamomea]